AVAPAAPVGEPMSTGLMGGISTSAAGDVAALTVGADRLAFSNPDGEETFAAPTEFRGLVDVSTPVAEGSQSFASAAPSSTATRVELRRIVGAAPAALCGGMAATHVALVSTEPLTGLQLMAFTGAEAPGPHARDSAVCAVYAYAVD
ncbi:MAG: hypothetical protein ACREH4_08645, partial [Vitreimonas sp.]